MSSFPFKRAAERDVWLDILGLDREPLTIPGLGARISKPTAEVTFHLKLLESRDLVKKPNDYEAEATLYATTLGKHPVWIAEAVKDHGPAVR